jgi:hypothetical protein
MGRIINGVERPSNHKFVAAATATSTEREKWKKKTTPINSFLKNYK